MLNQDSLAQLKGLKARMEAEKERAEATVKGTQARYGFAVLDDGREVFIPPDEMLKAFPDDRVKICVRPDRGGKTVADIEGLIECPIETFNGRCDVWVESGPGIDFLVEQPSGAYSCDFSPWDLLPGHFVSVGYQEPDGDWVGNVFEMTVAIDHMIYLPAIIGQ